MADVSFRVTGIDTAVHRVRANANLGACFEMTAAVAGAGQSARRVATAAVRVLQTQVTGDVAAAGGLTDVDSGRAGGAQTAAAVPTTVAQHAVDFGAVCGTRRRGSAGTYAVARC